MPANSAEGQYCPPSDIGRQGPSFIANIRYLGGNSKFNLTGNCRHSGLDQGHEHMLMLAGVLAKGIVKQFSISIEV